MVTMVRTRPGWQIDAKWICALLAIPVVSLCLLGFGLFQLTTESRSNAVVYGLASSLFTNPNDDVSISLTNLKQQLAPLYAQGPHGVALAASDDPVKQGQIEHQLGFLKLFTKQTHDKLGLILLGCAALALALLAGLIYFSHRFGRLVSVGLVLIASSFVGAAGFLTLQSGSGNNGVHISTVGPETLRLISSAFFSAYLGALILGVACLLVAGALKLFIRSS